MLSYGDYIGLNRIQIHCFDWGIGQINLPGKMKFKSISPGVRRKHKDDQLASVWLIIGSWFEALLIVISVRVGKAIILYPLDRLLRRHLRSNTGEFSLDPFGVWNTGARKIQHPPVSSKVDLQLPIISTQRVTE